MGSTGYVATMILQDAPGAVAKAELDDAVEQVKAIVNQPVAAYPRTPGAPVSVFSPGWFHAGALKPDFNHVDVRASQQLQYDQYTYVTSDLNPGLMFSGQDCEFNPMTKWAYTDRTLPKKKLTESEMVEINRLYRVIGADVDKLASMPEGVVIDGLPVIRHQDAASDDFLGTYAPYAPYVGGALVLAMIIALFMRRRSS